MYKTGRSVKRVLICPHCLQQNNQEGTLNQELLYEFSFFEVMDAFQRGEDAVYCSHINSTSRCVPIVTLAPDICMEDIPLIASEDTHIDRELGSGGFGTVYGGQVKLSAERTVEVAVKEVTISDEALDEEERLNQFFEFQHEAHLMSLMSDPHVVKFYGITKNPPRLIIELIHQGDLMKLLHPPLPSGELGSINPEELPWRVRLLIALDVARGMKHLHQMQPPITHRDLRSPNIFIDSLSEEISTVRAKVADFGLSRQTAVSLTGPLETWQWLAPEVLEGTHYNHMSDVYSFGICCWELATLQMPFAEYEACSEYCDEVTGFIMPHAIKPAIIRGLRPSAPKASSGAPKEFLALISRCLAREPSFRPTFGEIERLLFSMLGVQRRTGITLSSRRSAFSGDFAAKTTGRRRTLASTKHKALYEDANVVLAVHQGHREISTMNIINEWLLVGYRNGTIFMQDLDCESHQYLLQAYIEAILDIAYVPFSNAFWSINSNGAITILTHMEVGGKVDKERLPQLVHDEDPNKLTSACMKLVHLPGGRQTVWVSTSPVPNNQAVRIFSSSGVLLRVLEGDAPRIFEQYGPGGHVWMSNGKSIEIYDSESMESIASWEAHADSTISSMCFTGSTMWTGDTNGTVCSWIYEGETNIYRNHRSQVHGRSTITKMHYIEADNRLVSLTGATFIVWDLSQHKPLYEGTIQGDRPAPNHRLAIFHQRIYTTNGLEICCWSPSSNRTSTSLPANAFQRVAVSPHNRELHTGSSFISAYRTSSDDQIL